MGLYQFYWSYTIVSHARLRAHQSPSGGAQAFLAIGTVSWMILFAFVIMLVVGRLDFGLFPLALMAMFGFGIALCWSLYEAASNLPGALVAVPSSQALALHPVAVVLGAMLGSFILGILSWAIAAGWVQSRWNDSLAGPGHFDAWKGWD